MLIGGKLSKKVVCGQAMLLIIDETTISVDRQSSSAGGASVETV
jgi:hypothetical protein